MKLIRKIGTNFFLPDQNDPEIKDRKFFVYTDSSFIGNELNMENILNYKTKLIVCFHNIEIDYTSDRYLKNLLYNKHIIWLHSFNEYDIKNSPIITFDESCNVLNVFNLAFGNSIAIDKNNSISKIEYSAPRKSLIINISSGEFLIKVITSYSYFTQIEIPFIDIKEIVTGFNTSVSQNFGALLFQTIRYEGQPIQPKSPFVIKKNDGTSELQTNLISYFDDASFKNNVDLFVTIFPFKNYQNDSKQSSYLEFILKNEGKVKCNFINQNGEQYVVTNFNNFRASLARVEFDDKPRFFFIPDSGEEFGKLILNSEVQNPTTTSKLLLGFSGTEVFEYQGINIKLTFEKSNKLKVNDTKDDLDSVPKAQTSIISFNQLSYFLDSEKSPLFRNDKAQSSYKFIEKGKLEQPIKLPIIPTLSFKYNSDLIELENVFKKIRLRSIISAQPDKKLLSPEGEHITPQGFKKIGNNYDLIKGKSRLKSENSIDTNKSSLDTKDAAFQFTIIDNGELDISIRKDKVFFVLTPELFRQYLKNAQTSRIEAYFNIANTSDIKFIVDLLEKYPKQSAQSALKHGNSIIIIKFQKNKVSDLLKDLNKWSNEGNVLGNKDELKKIRSEIENLILKINDEYFLNTILEDENWNGVCVLNIPISNPDNLPPIFSGIAATQKFFEKEPSRSEKLQLETPLAFQYAAFPFNKTNVNSSNVVEITSTSFYGLIDYSPFLNGNDYKIIAQHFNDVIDEKKSNYNFILSKLFVQFRNSSISNFKSFSFLQIPKLFEDTVDSKSTQLKNPDENPGAPVVSKPNLFLLAGVYQKTSSGREEIQFRIEGELIKINFIGNNILKSIEVKKIEFRHDEDDKYRFDIGANVSFTDNVNGIGNIFSFDKDGLEFQNIGIKFKISTAKIPLPDFDFSRLLVIPKFNINGNGFLSSFPISFSHFQNFKLIQKQLAPGKFKLYLPEFDFKNIFLTFEIPDYPDEFSSDNIPNLFSFIFNFDLGTLGDLGGLKSLKGQLLVGWSFKGGFALGFKLEGPSSKELHLDLFGALKLDVKEVSWGNFSPTGDPKNCTAYYLRLNDAKLTVFGTQVPPKEKTFNGIIIYDFANSKIAWLINLIDNSSQSLRLGIGQRMGPEAKFVRNSTTEAIEDIRDTFTQKAPDCKSKLLNYNPQRNWLAASDDVIGLISDGWKDTLNLKFIFNDPALYGLHLGFRNAILKGLEIDILYKKISENQGVYALELQLPDRIRCYETGGAYFRLPNLGIEIHTNGDWKGDLGFPRTSNDWSRSGFLQLRSVPPFVGWFGFYITQSKTASLTLFNGYIDDNEKNELNVFQAGFAMRVGLGAYIDGGFFFIGASISVYGILEGAFAFEKGQKGLSKFFPDHYALLGRVGTIAEVVVYVDFIIIQASATFTLRSEYGLKLVYLSRNFNNAKKGLQPVKVYAEGEVIIKLRIKIGCIFIPLEFKKRIRFEFTIGGADSSRQISEQTMLAIDNLTYKQEDVYNIEINGIEDIPIVYFPEYTKIKEDMSDEKLVMIHSFFIPFFGKEKTGKNVKFTKSNLLKTKIIKPFFEDLIIGLKKNNIAKANTYEILRRALLNPQDRMYKVNIKLPKYRPTFIKGINSQDKATIEEILKKYFLFTDDEIKHCDTINCDPIIKTYLDFARIIPAPITTKIKVVEKGQSDYMTNSGFEIKIEGLVKNETGGTTINKKIDVIIKTEDDLKKTEEYFDDYKTQFFERKKSGERILQEPNSYDIRENVIVPEFFKLFALLTLEAFFEDTNPKDKTGESFDLTIENINNEGLFEYTIVDANGNNKLKNWDPNNRLEKIISQVNYFYNSGLRLPNEASMVKTQSLYEILSQKEVISPISPKVYSNVKISLDTKEITNDVFGEDTNIRNLNIKNMWDYIDSFTAPDFLKKLKDEFSPNEFKFVKPFELLPVTLAVQSGKLEVYNQTELESLFCEIPKNIAQNLYRYSRYSFELNFASYEKQDDSGKDLIEYSTAANSGSQDVKLIIKKCLNIRIKIKKHSDRVLEIQNVYVDDLNLINALKIDGFNIDSINLFSIPTNGDSTESIKLKKINNPRATILKTNLSPRTCPPIIEIQKLQNIKHSQDNSQKYLEDSDNANDAGKKNFIRLIWEGLTTNNGGYYIILDNDALTGVAINTVILSLESNQPIVPSYFNCIKLFNKPGYQIVFDLLKKNTHYLFLNKIFVDGDNQKEVKEFHPIIPAHTFGFEIIRNQKNTENSYMHYLPLEFDLYNVRDQEPILTPILTKEKVLPLMPTNQTENKNGKDEAIDGKLKYNLVLPLNVKNADPEDKHNIKRYETVGKKYRIGFNLRDTYGFRIEDINTNIVTKDYKHFYFDKLIPIESWPLMKFSYWFESFNNSKNTLSWKINSHSDIREILDLAGIERKSIDSFQYNYNEEIADPKHLVKIFNIIPGVLSTLYTIVAQLSDNKVKFKITNYDEILSMKQKEIFKLKVENLIELIIKIKTPKADKKYYMPSKSDEINISSIDIEIKPSESVKTELNFSIMIERPQENRLDTDEACGIFGYKKEDLKSENNCIWEYETTYYVSSTIHPLNSREGNKSTLSILNDAIRFATKELENPDDPARPLISKYSLGISSDEKTGKKVIYLINEGKLSNIKLTNEYASNNLINKNAYFGIKPYSNKLWSGKYTEKTRNEKISYQYDNIDLDKSLKIVLSKIDDLLQSTKLSEINKPTAGTDHYTLIGLYNKLVDAKKAIVENKLMNKVDWVLLEPKAKINKIEEDFKKNIEQGLGLLNPRIPSFELQKYSELVFSTLNNLYEPLDDIFSEFRSLLLSGLTNFYAYDGIVKTEIDELNLDLINHRLSVEIANHPGYNLISSKIGFKLKDRNGNYINKVNKNWYVLFDQKEGVKDSINFDLMPKITHIEFGIEKDKDTEIERSTWIQIIRPFQLKNGKYYIKDWPKITRVFPNKPVILSHSAKQSTPDIINPKPVWKIDKVGLWEYELNIKDNEYIQDKLNGDVIKIELWIKNASLRTNLASINSFDSFIAHWGSKFQLSTKSDSLTPLERVFINDLSNQFIDSLRSKTEDSPEIFLGGVEIQKISETEWQVKEKSGGLEKREVNISFKQDVVSVAIKGFDIFSKDEKIRSVSSSVKVIRNKIIPNKNFIYETEIVRPATSVTPYIKYFIPILINDTVTFKEIFESLKSLPYKSTAKLLINTDDLEKNRNARLPIVPIWQLEINKDQVPTDIDAIFTSTYHNGYPSISITAYSEDKESNLPIFFADNIFKKLLK